METISIQNIIKTGIYLLCLGVTTPNLKAQTADSPAVSLSLEDVIRHAKEANKLIGVLRTEESAAEADLWDGRMGALPRILSSASYQRYTKITLYDGVLGDSREVTKAPNANAGALNLEASFNLYAGGRQRSVVSDLQYKSELASVNTREQEASIGMQAALQYLDIIRIYFQQQLIADQVARARERSKNIDALYANGKVTKSDVLRADVLLSNVLLGEAAYTNDYRISNQKLNTLLNLPEFTRLIPADTTSLTLADTSEIEKLLGDYSGTYALLKIQKNIDVQQNRIKLTRSFNRPTVTLFGGYGLNYPNTLMFPPMAQTVAVGQAGVRLSYEISSLYQNRNKTKAARLREAALRQQKEWITDNVQQEANALALKYHEGLNRIVVTQKSVEQAEANYRIQNTKYFNQLGLLTDLLEADNLYQESRFNYVQAHISALSIYYRLLFVVGKL
jgi:outer membrane protein TolC